MTRVVIQRPMRLEKKLFCEGMLHLATYPTPQVLHLLKTKSTFKKLGEEMAAQFEPFAVYWLCHRDGWLDKDPDKGNEIQSFCDAHVQLHANLHKLDNLIQKSELLENEELGSVLLEQKTIHRRIRNLAEVTLKGLKELPMRVDASQEFFA
jgi:hypothetical protein